MGNPRYSPGHYGWLNAGSGAAKLADSAVAPLVGAARGYDTVTDLNVRDKLTEHRLGTLQEVKGRQVRNNIGSVAAGQDAMFMPWHSMDVVGKRAMRDAFAERTSLQIRPSSPIDGRKYVNIAGEDTVLDLHPATPMEWIDSAPRVLLTEGCIKGDSTLTALLEANGMDTELFADHGGDRLKAARALREVMLSIPADQRVLIISFIGVGNWHNNPEWNSVNWRGREAWIAYDADAATNAQVWRQAERLFDYLLNSKKTAEPRLVDLSEATDDPKAGLDDYFAAGGTFTQLSEMLTDLPPQPRGGGPERAGLWAVSEDGTETMQSVVIPDRNGMAGPPQWEVKLPLGGRVSSIWTRRTPTREEISSGVLGRGVSPETERSWYAQAGTEVEISWKDTISGTVRKALVSGPSAILATPPQDWGRVGAVTPPELLRHPNWPPRGNDGVGFLEAIKANRADESEESYLWEAMGWVPREGGVPGFLIGDTLITSEGPESSAGINGLSESELPGVSDFGVVLPDSEVEDSVGDDPGDWKEVARRDLAAVWDVFMDGGVWTNRRYAAITLAAALRPCVPVLSPLTIYLVGKRRSGKSWTAAEMMSFWQPIPGTWTNDHLPGSANDTFASTENALSRACIWVSDDLAPSASRDGAVRAESSMGDLIRMKFNGKGKKRMGADMRARESRDPRALYVVTAENEQSVSSVVDRVVTLTFGEGALGPTEATEAAMELSHRTGAPARLAYAFTRWYAVRAAAGEDNDGSLTGWQATYSAVQAQISRGMQSSARIMGKDLAPKDSGKATRHATIASHLVVTMYELKRFAEFLEVDDDLYERIASLDNADLIIDHIASCQQSQSMTEPGQSLMAAVSTVLSSGRAHLTNAADPRLPAGRDPMQSTRLGWVASGSGDMRAQGPSIGYLAEDKEGRQVVMLNAVNAFNAARNNHPELIPYGSKQAAGWRSVWEEGYGYEGPGIYRRKVSSGMSVSAQIDAGDNRVSGVPVLLEPLLAAGFGGMPGDEDQEEAA